MSEQSKPSELVDLNGEVFSSTDPMRLAPAFAEAKAIEAQAKGWSALLKAAIVKLVEHTPGRGRTRRLVAAGVTIKVTLPKEEIDAKTLMEAWVTWPELAAKYLRISEVAPIAVEV